MTKRTPMTKHTLMIDIKTLPLRPTGLSDDALQDVFGGCVGEGDACVRESDCCDLACMGPRGHIGHCG